MKIKTRINKWNLIKPNSFCTMKKAISMVKRQPSEWEKILIKANGTTYNGILSKIYNEEKTVSSINGAAKIGQLHLKE